MKPSQATKWTGRMIYSLAAILACFPPSRPATAQDAPGPQARLYAPGTIWPVHITVSTGEYDAIQPKGGMGFPGFRPPAREPEAPGKPKREVHRNNFGMDLPWGTGSITVGNRDYGTVGMSPVMDDAVGDAATHSGRGSCPRHPWLVEKEGFVHRSRAPNAGAERRSEWVDF